MKNILISVTIIICSYIDAQPIKHKNDFTPDVSISSINLLDSINITTFLGKDVMSNLSGSIFPSASFFSSNKDEVLEVVFHPGSKKLEFSEIKVYRAKGQEVTKVVDAVKFVTDSNVSLGLKMLDFLKIKGQPHRKLKESKGVVLEYTINDIVNSKFLQKYNMPIYYAKYHFENNILVKFEYGFEYP